MALSAGERALFSAAQLVELDRLTDTRLENVFLSVTDDDGNTIPMDAAQRSEALADWASLAVDQLRAIVNIQSTSQSGVTYSSENNYTTVEQQEINDIFANNTTPNVRNLPSFLNRSVAYAEVSANTAGPQQIGIGTTYVKITQFDTTGEILNCTVASNAVTVGVSGVFRAAYSIAFTGTINTTYTIALFVDGTEIVKSKSGYRLLASNDIGMVSSFAIGKLASGAEIDIRVKGDAAGKDFTVQAGNFELIRLR